MSRDILLSARDILTAVFPASSRDIRLSARDGLIKNIFREAVERRASALHRRAPLLLRRALDNHMHAPLILK